MYYYYYYYYYHHRHKQLGLLLMFLPAIYVGFGAQRMCVCGEHAKNRQICPIYRAQVAPIQPTSPNACPRLVEVPTPYRNA